MRFGNYILLHKLATGGMAEAFLAKQTGLAGFERLVCIKRILPHLAEHAEFINMFLDEARIAAKLNHPNVVQIIELGEIQGSYFIAMEYIRGEDVRHIYNAEVARERPMPFAAACQILHGALMGLAFAHRATNLQGQPMGVVHRDISPQNIMVTYDGNVKVVDFGVAKARDKMAETRSGVLKGKYSYMSPEQANGKEVDARSDIFAAGIILYEITTGQRLFKRENELETLHAVMECQIIPPGQVLPEYPKDLERILMKGLAPAAQDRYQRADDMARDLEEFLLAAGSSPSPTALGAYMQELFADKVVDDLFAEGSEGEYQEGEGSPVSKPSTRISRSSSKGSRSKRPMVRWSDRSAVSAPREGDGVEGEQAEPRPGAELLESLPTAGFVGVAHDPGATIIEDRLPSNATRSQPRRMHPEGSLSRAFIAAARQRPGLSFGLMVVLVLGLGVALMALIINSSGEPSGPVSGLAPPPGTELPATRDPQRTAAISMMSDPPAATVSFPDLPADDPAVREAAAARTNFDLRAGLPKGARIRLHITRAGYLPQEQVVDPNDETAVRMGVSVKLLRDLSQTVMAGVSLITQPPGASVYIDGVPTGQKTPLSNFQVEAGTQHKFEFVLDGYHSKAVTQEVPAPRPGEPGVSIMMSLNPIAAGVQDGATEAPPSNPKPPAQPSPHAEPRDGFLVVKTGIPYRVMTGGRELGLSNTRIRLKPGRYSLVLLNSQYGVTQDLGAFVGPGEEVTKTIPHGQGDLGVQAVPYATVWITDTKKEETPTQFRGLVAGRYVVTARCPDNRIQKQTVAIRIGEKKAIKFSCQK